MFVRAGKVEGRREEKRGMREGDGRELRGMGEEINGGEWRRGWRKERDGERRQVEERREMEEGEGWRKERGGGGGDGWMGRGGWREEYVNGKLRCCASYIAADILPLNPLAC